MPEFDVNYLAVGAAAIATMVVGALWYSPLMFGKLWLEVHGYTGEKMAEMQKKAGRAYLVSFVCYLVMAFVLAVLVSSTGVSTIGQGAFLGFFLWIGFLATMGLTSYMFSDKPLSAYLLDAGYQLVYAVVMAVILTAWR